MSEQIVITGEAGDSVFYASKILMKCPSKYHNPEANKPL
jgi:cytochrome c-type biogenesis protein CcmE